MKAEGIIEPRNLEEQARVLIGNDIYELLIKGYTENNGDVNVLIYQLLSLKDYLSVSF